MSTFYKITAGLLLLTSVQVMPSFAQAKKVNKQAASQKSNKTPIVQKVAVDSVSYALGMDVAKSLATSGVEINSLSFTKGMEAVLKQQQALFGEEEKIRILKDAFTKAAELKVTAQKKEENAFFETIKGKPNVQHLQEGLYYEVIVQGTGAKPTEADEVNVHYKGTLVNGKVFDSSYDRGAPLDLALGRVIRGWQLGIPLMSVGAKYRFYIPSALAYGERDMGEIPPFSALIFDIELLGIKSNDAVQ